MAATWLTSSAAAAAITTRPRSASTAGGVLLRSWVPASRRVPGMDAASGRRTLVVVGSSGGRRAGDEKGRGGVTETAAMDILEPLDLGDETAAADGEQMRSWAALPSRFKLLITAFVSYVICNMDKVNMSVAIIPMAHEFGWNSTVSGLVQSAFFYGYMFCQLPGGYLSTRFSGSRMLPIGVGVWSAATFGLPVVGSSVTGLCGSRAFVGVGEALAPAAVADVIGKMTPIEERSRSVAFVNSGLYLGTILGLLSSPLLIDWFGWHSVFYVFGGIGLLWVVWWETLVGDLETDDKETYNTIKGITSQSQGTTTVSSNKGDIPWRAMLRARPVQALMYTHFCSAWFHFTLLSWLPTYFSSTLGLGLGDAARISLIPPVAGIVVSSIAGPAADALISNGVRPGIVRKLAQCTAFIGPSLCLVGASYTDQADLKIALITGSIGLGSFCLAGLYCNSQDLSPKYAGFLLSLSTTFSALPGIIGVAVTGALLDATDSWAIALFAPSVFFMLTGAYVFGRFGRAHEHAFADNRPFAFEKHDRFRWIWDKLPFET